jgi:hypothetical protein
MNKFPFSSLHPNAGPHLQAKIALHPTFFLDLNVGVLSTNGHMNKFSPASNQNLPSCGVQLDLADT